MYRNRFDREDLRHRELGASWPRRPERFATARGGGMRGEHEEPDDPAGAYDADDDPGGEHCEAQGRRFARETGEFRRYDSDRASSYQGPVYPLRDVGGDETRAATWFAPARPMRRDWERGEVYGGNVYRGERYGHAPGGFAGRGPSGYRRNDERICEDVCDHLTEHAQIDASDVRVRVADGEVFLTGTVATREQKRLAEDIAEMARGVRDVRNEIRVQPADGAPGDERGMTGERLSVDRQVKPTDRTA
ncbi:MAG: BON domain-containing protein [Deltaproteobacteria bacterium]|nr:BON domain-containing protein [Deltaproteobacteria bacterium]